MESTIRYTDIPVTWDEALALYTARRDKTTGERPLQHKTRLVNPTYAQHGETPTRLDLYFRGQKIARYFPTDDVTIYPNGRGEIERHRLNSVLAGRGEIDDTWLYTPNNSTTYQPTFVRNMMAVDHYGYTQQVQR